MDLISKLEQEEIKRLNRKIPEFAPGDTVIVKVQVVEGDKKREQAYEGVVIAKRNRGLNSSFIVRKISSGEGVERTFQTYSPAVASIEVKRRATCAAPSSTTCAASPARTARIREKLTSRGGPRGAAAARRGRSGGCARREVASRRRSNEKPAFSAGFFRLVARAHSSARV